MNVQQHIKNENLEARKRRDKFTTNVLTTLYSEISKVGKDKGNRDTTDEEAYSIIKKFKKDIQSTISLLIGEEDMNHLNFATMSKVTELQKEVNIYDTYLPQTMGEENLTSFINEIITSLDKPNIGSVMGQLKKSGYSYDGKLASTIIRKALS